MPSRLQRRVTPSRRPSPYPDRQALTAGLRAVLSGHGPGGGRLTVVRRRRNAYASTFPSEVVTCRLADGGKRRLFCKYAAGLDHNAHGHRGGVGYEAEVYRRVLEPSAAPAPRFYGTYSGGAADDSWLILEYLEKSERLNKALEPTAMGLAARWIGRFHAAQEARLARASLSFLNVYDAEYYRGWVRRTSLFAGHWHRRFTWLAPLCERLEGFVALLIAAPPTVIHGEYYPRNVLVRGRMVYPVDWESAAVAAGEIDFATQVEDWPPEIAGECRREYQQARWPDGAPADFERRLGAARLYLLFRWLGDRPDWTAARDSGPYLQRLRSAGERLGLI